jgi:hydroxyethylthiazole kinase
MRHFLLGERMINTQELWRDIENIRSRAPLIHNITNYVVMNSTANALLALGASPIMAHAPEEMEEMVNIASALVINIGTLSTHWIDAMHLAGKAAQKKGIPIILDPVGAGASHLRTQTAHELLVGVGPAIVRGNASEIISLASMEGKTKGVDSVHASEAARDAALVLCNTYNCVVSISGATDIVCDKSTAIAVQNGHEMMPRVTGLGCTASALTGAFAAVNESRLKAAAHAMAVMGTAGEIAAQKAPGPGSLQFHFLDALYQLELSVLSDRVKSEVL